VKDLRSQIAVEEDNIAFYDQRRAACEESQKNIVGPRRDCSRIYEEQRKRSEWRIEQIKTKIEVELPEQARKAGAMPGWLRE
jgi:hypothetical protein